MSNPTPQEMLKLYRAEAPPFDNEQARLFQQMPENDRMELLMYMSLINYKIAQYLHEKIEGASPIPRVPDVPRGH